VVVDNASTDGSAELIEEQFPEIELLRSEVNLGFAAGNNVGIRHAMRAGAEYVALLNMDTTVDPAWLRRLVETADETPDAALLGARILHADGQMVEFDGQQFDPVTTSGGYADYPVNQHRIATGEAAYACGAALLMRASAFQEIGLLDETFFLYHEDVELSLRVWLRGHRVLNVADAIVFHEGGGAGGGTELRDFMGTRNLLLTLTKLCDGQAWSRHGKQLTSLFLSRDRLPAVFSALFQVPTALERRRLQRSSVASGEFSKLMKRLGRLSG
jgi:GT2 family glycosyltransferase